MPELDKIINNQGLVSSQQVGYKKHSTTQLNILITAGNIKEVINISNNKFGNNKYYVLFIDFSSAFDSVSHLILIEKLK